MAETPTKKVSIVIPTLNRGAMLYSTLHDLLAQEYPDFEIIVVDQTRAYPETETALLESIAGSYRTIRQEVPDVVAACNRGVEAACGEIIILVDDDVSIPNRMFIAAHLNQYSDSAIGGVAGQILHENQIEPRPQHPRYGKDPLSWMFVRFDTAQYYDIESCGAGNFSFRKKIWEELGGFDERFIRNAFCWESDYCFRMRKAGYRLVFSPHAPLIHLYWKSKGGCENYNLFSTGSDAYEYLAYFFRNNLYFFLKNEKLLLLPLFLWRLYRQHIGNRIYLRLGVSAAIKRHYACCKGLVLGVRVWQAWRVQKRDTGSAPPHAALQ